MRRQAIFPEIEAEDTISDLDVFITGRYWPGCKETGPTYDCGGTPASPDEMEDVCVWLCKLVVKDGKREVIKIEISDFLTEKQIEQATQALWDRVSQL